MFGKFCPGKNVQEVVTMKLFERNRGIAVVGILFAVGLILMGAAIIVGPAGFGSDFSFNFGSSNLGERFEREYNESLYQIIEAIDIYTLNGAVEVIGWERDYAAIEVRQSVRVSSEELKDDYFERTKPEITVSENTLKIVTPRLQLTAELKGYGTSIYLKVPTALIKETQVRTSNGNMRFSSLNAYINASGSNGGIDISTVNGKIVAKTSNGRIEAIDIFGSMEFESSNGSFTGKRLEGDLRISTSNASINIDSSISTVVANTSNGSINVTGSTLVGTKNSFRTSNGKIIIDSILPESGELEIESSNGQITLYLPDSINAHIDALTSNGKVDINGLPITISSMTKTSVKGNLNGGSDIDISVKTSNADINLRKK